MAFLYFPFVLSLLFLGASGFRYNRPYQVVSPSFYNGQHQLYSPSKAFQVHNRPSILSAAPVTTPSQVTKRSLEDLGPHELSGKRVLVRCDLNVPLDGTTITDDTRIRASIKTIQYLVGSGAKVLLATHLGRPKGVADPKYSVAIIKGRIEELLNKPILICDDCIGDAVTAKVNTMLSGDVLLLENVRFHSEETANDESFARSLTLNADLYVNDAFGAAHRAHASTEGVARILKPSVAGFLMKKELDFLSNAVAQAQRPFAAIVGGSKISSKIGVMEALLDKVDKLIIGGAMVFTFLKARGMNVGSSLIEDDKLETAQRLEFMAKQKGVEFILPTDVVIGNEFSADADDKVVPIESIPDGWWGLDNGPESTKLIVSKLQDCKTILWNGPMGKFEFEKFSKGTTELAKAMAAMTAKGTVTIVGGGDSVAAVTKSGLANEISHISTGGGASLELLEGKPLPGVTVLNDL